METIALFNGSIRKGQKTSLVTDFVADVIDKRNEYVPEIITLERFGISMEDEGKHASKSELDDIVEKAAGYIIVAPEYNHGYPGSLKYLLDMNLRAYIHKPVALAGVSSGPYGGTRVIEQLVTVVRELGMVVTFTDLNVSHVGDEFLDKKVEDEKKWQKRVDRMLDELSWMMQTLKYGRENIQSIHHQ